MRNLFSSNTGKTSSAIVTLTALFSVVLLVTMVAATVEDYFRTLAVAETRTRAATDVLEEHVHRVLDVSERVLAHVVDRTRQVGVQALAGAPGYKELNRLAATLPESGSLWLVGADGFLLASSRSDRPPRLYLGDRPYWLAHQAGEELFMGPMAAGGLTDEGLYTYSRAIRSPTGQLLGIVVAAIVPTYVSEYLSWAGDGIHLTFGLYKEDGTIVLRLPFDRSQAAKNISGSRIFTDFYPRVQAANYRTTSVVDGQDRICAFKKVRNLPVLVGASVLADEAFAEWRRRLYRNASVTLVALVGLGGLSCHALRAHRRERESQFRAMEAAAKLALALDAAHAAIWEWEVPSGRMEWSPGNWRMLGLPRQIRPSPGVWRSCILPEDRPAVEAVLEAAIRERRHSFGVEYRIASRTGSRWIFSPTNLYFDASGKLVRLAGVNIDVTRLKETEAWLLAAREEAERANEAKSKFLAAASHDLRQPAQSLALLIATLGPQVAGTPVEKVTRLMEQSLEALNQLLSSLLDVSRLDAGIVVPEPRPIAIGHIMARLAAEYAEQAADHGLRLRYVPSSRWVTSDPVLLERILRNLIENALRYTTSGGILLGCRLEGGRVVVSVADTGKGIPADELDHVFEEFVQLHNPSRDRTHGLGLGLAIVRRLVNLLDADLRVRSTTGRGSCFGVVLPGQAPLDAPMSPGPQQEFVPAA